MYLLLPFAWIYGMVTSIRNFLYDHQILRAASFDFPIICVGNITVGGTGKTPMTEYLIRLLQQEGYRVAVLSRGYKRKTKGFVLASQETTVADIGDEPFQIKRKFSNACVAVDVDRKEGISRLLEMKEEHPIDVILLDDAFQHRRVNPGLSLLLVDSNRPLYDDHLMPMGRMREQLKGIRRADIVVMTKMEQIPDGPMKEECRKRLKLCRQQDLLFSGLKYKNVCQGEKTIPLDRLSDYHVLLLTGIANPEPLERQIGKYTRIWTSRFGDHHDFTASDYVRIEQEYEAMPTDKPRIVVTTEKDRVRLDDSRLTMKDCLYEIPIEVMFLDNKDQEYVKHRLLAYVRKNSRNSSIPQREND